MTAAVTCERCGAQTDPQELAGICPRCVGRRILGELERARPEPGRRLGRYTLGSRVGRTDEGELYRARDEEAGRDVVLTLLANAAALGRHEREVEISRRLEHPGVVPTLGAGQAEGDCFVVRAWVEGRGLTETALEVRQAVEVVRKLAAAVHFAHEKGVLHGDLRPERIVLRPDGEPMIAGFAWSKDASLKGHVPELPVYAAPELVSGRFHEVDARTDVYGLGAILHHLLARRPPFEGKSASEVVRAVLRGRPPRIKDVPRPLEDACRKAMAPSRDQRHASALALAEDLERALAGKPPPGKPAEKPAEARPPGPLAQLVRRAAKRPLVWGVPAGVLALVVAAVFLVLWFRGAQVRTDRLSQLRTLRGQLERGSGGEDLVRLRSEIGETSTDWELWLELGRCYAAADARRNAVECLSRAADLKPDLAAAYDARAKVRLRDYLILGDTSLWSAMDDDAKRSGNPALPLVLSALRDHEGGRFDESRRKSDRAVEMDPSLKAVLSRKRP